MEAQILHSALIKHSALMNHFLALAAAVAVGRHLDVNARQRLGTLHAREGVVAHALHLLLASNGGDCIKFLQLLCLIV